MTFVKEISRCFCSVCQNSLILRDKDVSRKILYSNGWKLGAIIISNTCPILDGNFCRVGVN